MMVYPKFIVSNQKEEPISIQKVNGDINFVFSFVDPHVLLDK